MSGINHGRKFTYTFNVNESNKKQEGVSFGNKSKKYLVTVKNQSKSKSARPYIIIVNLKKKKML